MLTYEEEGDIIAKIVDAPRIKFDHIRIINRKDKIKPKIKFNQITLQEGRFKYCPDKKRERDVILYLGKAGSGKSYQINEYLVEFMKVHPRIPIYMFSEKESTSSIKVPYRRIKLDETLQELKWSDFENSMCVFDDVDGLNEKLRKIVYTLRDKMLKLGREKKINVLMSNHNSTDGKETKSPLGEANVIVLFLANYNRMMKYLLIDYLGLDTHQIKKLRNNVDSRATYFLMGYPNIVLQDNFISTLAEL